MAPIRVTWQGGARIAPSPTTAPGTSWAVTTTWAAVGRTTPSAAWQAAVSWAPGKGGIQGLVPGAAFNVSAAWVGGAASVPIKPAPGAALAATVAWSAGEATLQGGTASGAALNVGVAWVGGGAQSIGPGAAWNVSAVFLPDVPFSKVALQIPGDGTNNSTNIIDVSNNALTITRHGAPVISTAASANGGASVRFNASSTDALSLNSSALTVGAEDFWIECRLKFLTSNFFTAYYVSYNHDLSTFAGSGSYLYVAQLSGKIRVALVALTTDNQTSQAAAVDVAVTLTDFNHLTAGRIGSQLAVWVNGTIYQDTLGFIDGNKNIGTRTIKALGDRMHIGARKVSTGYDNGTDAYLDDFRFVKATAPWGLANYSPPVGPHPTS